MNKQVSKLRKITLLTFLMCAFVFSANAQFTAKKKGKKRAIVHNSANNSNSTFLGCSSNLAYKKGEVFSVAPGIITAIPTSDKVTVSVKKTGGRAETQVNIYVNNVFKKKIEFDNGNTTSGYKNRVLTGVKNKMIKVEIVNQSVANTFKYTAKIVGKRKTTMKDGKVAKGTLIGQGFKKAYALKSCTGKTRVVVRRKSGIARATIRVFEKVGNTYSHQVESVTFERNETVKKIVINSDKKLKVELKNVSVGNLIEYKINTIAIQ